MTEPVTHPSALDLSMYVDRELESEAYSSVSSHLDDCDACRSKVAIATQERNAISAGMAATSVVDEARVAPKFKRPASLKGFAMANILTGLVIWLAQFLWKTIFGEVFMNLASWITSIYIPDTYELITTTALYYLEEGTAMFDAYLGFILLALSVVTVLWLVISLRRHRSLSSLCLLLLVGVVTTLPTPASALELRRAEGVVTVAANETIDDTLLAAGETVVVKGNISGDLIAAGRRIEIEGDVAGNVLAFGESIEIHGRVGGFVLSGGSTVDLEGAQVTGDFWGMGDKLSVNDESRIGRNTIVFGQRAVVEGATRTDLYAFADLLELNSTVGRNLEVFGNRARLLDQAHVLGNANFHMSSEEKLEQAPGAKIDGNTEFSVLPQDMQPTNRYLTVSFYLWQVTKLLAALLFGLALLWLIPGLRGSSISGGVDGLKTAGIGFITLISLPIIAAFVTITLVGIPFALIGVFAWITVWYAAKIVVAVFVGQLILGDSDQPSSDFKILLAGLAVVIIAINLPYVGGVINFVLTIVGVGMITQFVMQTLARRNV